MNVQRYTAWILRDHDLLAAVEVRWYGGCQYSVHMDGADVDVFSVWGRGGDSPTLAEADVAAREHMEDMVLDLHSEA